MKKVTINITGVQYIDDLSDTTQFFCEGLLKKSVDDFVIKYTEGELAGNKPTQTELILKKDGTAILNRNGGMTSKLIIKKGERNNCQYFTPQGELMIGIFGEQVDVDLTENGGCVNLAYTIDSNMKQISKNEVKITIKEV